MTGPAAVTEPAAVTDPGAVTEPAAVTEWAAVIGVGNVFRRDDGVGHAVVDMMATQPPPGVRLVRTDGEPSRLLDAWAGVRLAILVDAAVCDPPSPGRIHRTSVNARPGGAATSSHGLGVPEAVELGDALGRLPERLLVLTVEAADVRQGPGLSAPVAAALPRLAAQVRRELESAAGPCIVGSPPPAI